MAKKFSKKKSPTTGSVLWQIIAEDNALRANCFSLNADGLKEGFNLLLHVPRQGGGEHPPHLNVGGMFCNRNNKAGLGCIYHPQTGLVRRAELVTINPADGRKPFTVLNRPFKNVSSPHLVCVNTNLHLPKGVKMKKDHKIWTGISGTAEVVFFGSGESLVRFSREGDYVVAMYPNGLVHKLSLAEGELIFHPLGMLQMAEIRVEDALQRIVGTKDVRHRDGVLHGVASLIPLTKRCPEARGVLIDFFSNEDLPHTVRERVRKVLAGLGDPQALKFSNNSGFTIKESGDRGGHKKNTFGELANRLKMAG